MTTGLLDPASDFSCVLQEVDSRELHRGWTKITVSRTAARKRASVILASASDPGRTTEDRRQTGRHYMDASCSISLSLHPPQPSPSAPTLIHAAELGGVRGVPVGRLGVMCGSVSVSASKLSLGRGCGCVCVASASASVCGRQRQQRRQRFSTAQRGGRIAWTMCCHLLPSCAVVSLLAVYKPSGHEDNSHSLPPLPPLWNRNNQHMHVAWLLDGSSMHISPPSGRQTLDAGSRQAVTHAGEESGESVSPPAEARLSVSSPSLRTD